MHTLLSQDVVLVCSVIKLRHAVCRLFMNWEKTIYKERVTQFSSRQNIIKFFNKNSIKTSLAAAVSNPYFLLKLKTGAEKIIPEDFSWRFFQRIFPEDIFWRFFIKIFPEDFFPRKSSSEAVIILYAKNQTPEWWILGGGYSSCCDEGKQSQP